jgi:hypothetical protein
MQALVDTGAFPAFERALSSGFDLDLDQLFEFGLQRFLDGIAALPRR